MLVNMIFNVIFARMIVRKAQVDFLKLLEEFPAVAILGPRQIGKTTLAEEIARAYLSRP